MAIKETKGSSRYLWSVLATLQTHEVLLTVRDTSTQV